MAEEIYLFTKDGVTIKAPKKSPALLRTIVLVFLMVCGVYICSICLTQTGFGTKTKFLNTEVVESYCHEYGIDRSLTPHLHYPRPKTFHRAECSCNPVRLFAIVSMQRSGSGWFETLLNSHINVSSNGEIFSVMERRENASSITKTLDRVYNLDWFTSASKNQCSAAVGFKWMLNQGLMEHHKEIVEYFNDRGVSVIFLFRKNLLRRMVSVMANSYDRYAKLLNGTHKSHVHSLEEAEILSTYKPVINLTSLIMDLKQMEMTVRKTLEQFRSTRHIILYYEELVKNRTACSILASLFVALILIMSQNLHPTQGRRYPSFRTQKNVMNGGSNDDSLSEINTMEAVVPAVKEATPPGPAAMLPRPPPPPPPTPAATVGGAPGHADNFRPTAPGHSPGIGNSMHN